jgi:hypothetical protein
MLTANWTCADLRQFGSFGRQGRCEGGSQATSTRFDTSSRSGGTWKNGVETVKRDRLRLLKIIGVAVFSRRCPKVCDRHFVTPFREFTTRTNCTLYS